MTNINRLKIILVKKENRAIIIKGIRSQPYYNK